MRSGPGCLLGCPPRWLATGVLAHAPCLPRIWWLALLVVHNQTASGGQLAKVRLRSEQKREQYGGKFV
jgi:hypothetical protein